MKIPLPLKKKKFNKASYNKSNRKFNQEFKKEKFNEEDEEVKLFERTTKTCRNVITESFPLDC